jgi:glutaredoxin 3
MKISVNNPILYVKQGCPWCIDALAYFKQKNIELEIVDVRADPARMKELQEISGQTMTPTLKHGDFMVKDFDLAEFEKALSENPQAAKKLGLA